ARRAGRGVVREAHALSVAGVGGVALALRRITARGVGRREVREAVAEAVAGIGGVALALVGAPARRAEGLVEAFRRGGVDLTVGGGVVEEARIDGRFPRGLTSAGGETERAEEHETSAKGSHRTNYGTTRVPAAKTPETREADLSVGFGGS